MKWLVGIIEVVQALLAPPSSGAGGVFLHEDSLKEGSCRERQRDENCNLQEKADPTLCSRINERKLYILHLYPMEVVQESEVAYLNPPSSKADPSRKNEPIMISPHLEENLEQIRKLTAGSPDFIIRRFTVGMDDPCPAALVYLSSMVNLDTVNQLVLGSVMGWSERVRDADMDSAEQVFQQLQEHALTMGNIQIHRKWSQMMAGLLSGDTLIFLQGCNRIISCNTPGGPERSISEPTTQSNIRGPKEGFVESLFTNVALLRRRIKNSDLTLEMFEVGNYTGTNVAMMYMKNIAEEEVVNEVRSRIHGIRTDAILDSGMVEDFIQDKTFTPFPTVYNSERPDTAAGNLMEGRIILLVDGSPFVLIMPIVFAQFFQSASDYAERYDSATLLRILRYICFIILILGPSLYIAFTTYHYEMIPTPLLISILAQRETVPFPAIVEAFILEFTMEVLREAGVRMPRVVGQTVSVVGALVLGQAAVEAGVVTALLTIVVAITGIASFAIPSYNMATAGRLCRFVFMVLAALFGLYGVTLGLIVLAAHLCSLQSFGVPYMAPFSPFRLKSNKDTVLRLPAWMMRTRPAMFSNKNNRRMPEESGGKSPIKGE